MNKNQQKYTAFMESVCKQFNHPEMLPTLNAGFKAFCEASDNAFNLPDDIADSIRKSIDEKNWPNYFAAMKKKKQFLKEHNLLDDQTDIIQKQRKILKAKGLLDKPYKMIRVMHQFIKEKGLLDEFEQMLYGDCKETPALESIGIYNAMRLTTDEMLLLQEMRQYYKDLCRDGWMSDFLHGGGNPLSAADNLALLDALVEMYGSVEDLPEGFLALYHKLGGKKI